MRRKSSEQFPKFFQPTAPARAKFAGPDAAIPTVIPDNVTGLVATSGNGEILLSWNASKNAQQYKVYNGPGPTVTTGDTLIATISGKSYTHTGRTNGTEYFYAVLATNVVGDAAAISATDSAIPAITAPENVAASSDTSTEVDVSWDAVTGATSYDIYFATAPGVDKLDTLIAGVTSPYTHTGRTNGTQYHYVVVAKDALTESGVSSESSAVPLAVPADLGIVSGDTANRLSWGTITGATSYDIYRVTSSPVTTGDLLATGVTSPYDDTGLTAGTEYFYAIRAKATNSETGLSNEISAAPGKRWFLLMGQSNMSGRDTIVGATDDVITGFEGITKLDSNDLEVDCIHPIHYDASAAFGPGRDFAKRVQDTVGDNVGLIPCAVGGSYLYQWDPNETDLGYGEGDLYDEAIRRAGIVTAAGGTIAGVLWLQGEADALTGTSRGGNDTYASRSSTYGSRLEAMIADLRTDLGISALPFVAAEIGAHDGGPPHTITIYYEDDFENNVSNAEYEEYPGTKVLIDSYHYSRTDQIQWGGLYGQAYLRITGEVIPEAVSNYQISAGNAQTTHTWTNDPDATSYNIRWGTSSGSLTNTITGVTSGYVHTGLSNGTTYYYKVDAINSNGTGSTAEASSTPVSGQSIQFVAASSQWCEYLDSGGALGGTELTIRCSVRLDSLPSTNSVRTIVSKFGLQTAKRCFILRVADVGGANQYWECQVLSDGTNKIQVRWGSGSGIAIDTNYDLVFKFDGAQSGAAAQVSLTVNGSDPGNESVVTDNTISSMQTSTTSKLGVGASDYYGQYWDGRIDNLELYSDLAESSLEMEYLFDNDATDNSGNGRDLTANNTPTYGDPL